ncbi:NAD(P)-dependent oxidoreductase [Jeongeupia sp. HS-3]|uniref:dTDP-4-dehydrorhamnose reductase n=1 Tax=Jeongeupia sp. HS-3 TaxID=1009682 RepID=UPI0018A60FAE|nr:dTDP-4-dehydrorhamnose reductase [Jeongeupia sp. HS-3]BCL76535.1 NAD(P)-dependent oxidoreductase [Jeongeupia sp. HS-3]
MPRILLTGKNGQIGFELQRSLAVLGEVIAVGRRDCDFANPDVLRALVQDIRPDVIVNAAGYTAVDQAEREPELAYAVNAMAPSILAAEALRLDALLLHYSSDYVFDGRKAEPYLETDTPKPLSVYGRSKLAGEEAIHASGCRYLIVRISWVFGAHGDNFLKTILRLAHERQHLEVVADQYGAPTVASLIADISAQLLVECLQREQIQGTYHLTAAGETSWHGYAQTIVRAAQALGMPLTLSAEAIRAVTAIEYPLTAARPANSRLDTRKLRQALGTTLPQWQIGVADVIKQLYGTAR